MSISYSATFNNNAAPWMARHKMYKQKGGVSPALILRLTIALFRLFGLLWRLLLTLLLLLLLLLFGPGLWRRRLRIVAHRDLVFDVLHALNFLHPFLQVILRLLGINCSAQRHRSVVDRNI